MKENKNKNIFKSQVIHDDDGNTLVVPSKSDTIINKIRNVIHINIKDHNKKY